MARRFDPEAFHKHPNPLVRAVERARVRAVCAFLQATPGMRVVEVGCGPGALLLALPEALRPLGVDHSPRLLRRARERLAHASPLTRADAERLPIATSSVDRVLCSELLEHTLAPGAVLAEVARVLRPGALAVVSVPEEERVDAIKDTLARLGLGRWLLGARERQSSHQPAPAGAHAAPGSYRMAARMSDEWHLHTFSLELLLSLAPTELVPRRARAVPFPGLALRWVVQFERI